MTICNVCQERPKGAGRGRRTCDECYGKCKHCKQLLGADRRCRPCAKVRNRERYQRDPEYAAKKRVTNKLSLYGISQDQYDSLVWECAVCKETDGKLVIDHSHESGEVRGVLCNNCNTALGMLNEDVERMKNLIRYTEESR